MERSEYEERAERTILYTTYKKRFLILFITCLAIFISAYQQFEYVAIGNVIIKFYGTNYQVINWTYLMKALAILLVFIPFIFIANKFGFRNCLIMATFFNAIGANIKLMALNSKLFWLLMLGQSMPCSVGLLIAMIIPKMAGAWFRTDEVAMILGIRNAIYLGAAASAFLSPALIFKEAKTKEEIKIGLFYISICVAIFTVLVFILSILFARDKPPSPPSHAEQSRSQNKFSFYDCLKLFKNRNFILLYICDALSNAIWVSVTLTLNQAVFSLFKNASNVLTISGVLNSFSSILGSLTIGFITKRMPKYKMLQVIASGLLSLFTITYVLSLWLRSEWILFISASGIGAIGNANNVLSFDHVLEVSYPLSGSVTFSIMYMGHAILNMSLTPLVTALTSKFNAIIASLVLVISSLFVCVLTIFLNEDLRRRKADDEKKPLVSDK
ncbi:putative MFS-type transporter -like protein [Dinothrombium tinctorium]|uniref:Putative MFS-type transporter-like protein n=1 Tax=Dinothrombium tinctorium TaxID=1965070 RepID=A0A3S3P6D9_9ACAR|nr:putative MFS-type transporter -like protein [Dinothrombium tinctorium]